MRAAEKAPSVGLFRQHIGDADYLLAFVTPPAAEQATQKPLPREVVFVIDNSGSMGGTSIEQAKASLLYAIGRLQPNDRFNIIRFEDTMDVLFPVSLPADAAHVREAASFGRGAVLLQEEGAGFGLAGLQQACLLRRRRPARREVYQQGHEADQEHSNSLRQKEQSDVDQPAEPRMLIAVDHVIAHLTCSRRVFDDVEHRSGRLISRPE